MAPISAERQKHLTEFLLDEKRRLWNEVRRELFDKIGEGLGNQNEIPQDTGDRGLMDLLKDTGLAVADIRRQKLTLMDEALGRLREGQYGICEDCGEEIREERLRVSPYSIRCVACQTKKEGPPSGPGVRL